MRIAIDMDGTALRHVNFFKEFMKAMQNEGHEVGILTAHLPTEEQGDINLLLNLYFPEPDFYIGMPPGEKLIGLWKRKMVKEYNIDVLIDDFGGNNKDIEESFFNDTELDFLLLRVSPGE